MTEDQYPTQAGATLHDRARLAGASPICAPRGINDDGNLGERARGRVSNAVANRTLAGSLRIGLLHSNQGAAFLSTFLRGAEDRCCASGAALLTEKCTGPEGWQAAVEQLIANGAHGILLTPPLCDSHPVLEFLAELDVPVVAVASARPSQSMSAVRIDDYEGALSAVRHLISLGHHDIGFIKGDPEHSSAHLRYRAFLDAMGQARLEVRPDRVAEGLFTYRSGLAAARSLLGQATRPSAIFACSDDMAAAVLAVAQGLRLDIPGDLAVCGFDDTPLATTVWPQLTTVHQPIEEMGRVAVELVCEQMKRLRMRQPKGVEHRLLPCRLVSRMSSTPG